jgi:hypothetical protein
VKTATEVKEKRRISGVGAAWRLYALSEPLDGHSHVIVSANIVPYSGPETYIFGASTDGEIDDWCELDGSFRGGMDHEKALSNAGYEVIS